MKAIKKAEAEAERIIREARQQSRRKRKEAEEEGEAIFRKVVAETGEKGETIIDKAREEADAEVEPMLAEQKQEIARLQALAAERMPKAVSLLVDKVVKHDAHR